MPSPKRSEVTQLWKLASLATKLNIPRTTLASAVTRGEIPHWRTACGTILVREDDVRDWAFRGPDNLGIGKPRSWSAPKTV